LLDWIKSCGHVKGTRFILLDWDEISPRIKHSKSNSPQYPVLCFTQVLDYPHGMSPTQFCIPFFTFSASCFLIDRGEVEGRRLSTQLSWDGRGKKTVIMQTWQSLKLLPFSSMKSG
jgi:hypothetical protein